MGYHAPAEDGVRILIVSARPPWPARRGDQARTAGFVDELAGRHELRLVALRPSGFASSPAPDGVTLREVPLSIAAMAVGLLRRPAWPWQVAMHAPQALGNAVAEEVASFRPDVALLMLSRVAHVLPELGGIPAVVDLVDALELNLRNRAARQRWAAPALLLEARRIGRWERDLVRRARAATVVAERDRETLSGGDRQLAEHIHVVPFGVAVPDRLPEREAPRPVVLLSGNLGYFPTAEGAEWFASRVWPEVRRMVPAAEFILAGARPAERVRRLAALPGVSLEVDPADLATVRGRAAVALAPMRSGSGTPIKVLEAMAAGVPVVTTRESAMGLDGVPGEALAVADGAVAFASSIAALLTDPGAARLQAEAAFEWVRARHARAASAGRMEEILASAAG